MNRRLKVNDGERGGGGEEREKLKKIKGDLGFVEIG